MIDYVLDDMIGTNGVMGVNVVADAITNGTGRAIANPFLTVLGTLTLPLNDIFIDVPLAGTHMRVGLSQVTLADINTWQTFDMLEPITAYHLLSNVLLGTVDVNFTFYVNMTVDSSIAYDPQYLYFSGGANLHLTENRVHTQLQVVVVSLRLVNDSKMSLYPSLSENYTNAQFVELGCLLALLGPDTTAFSSLVVNLTSAQLAVLLAPIYDEQDIANALNNFITLALSSYTPSLPALIAGITSGPILNATNEEIYNILHANVCEYKVN